jgi:hypothetical protein
MSLFHTRRGWSSPSKVERQLGAKSHLVNTSFDTERLSPFNKRVVHGPIDSGIVDLNSQHYLRGEPCDEIDCQSADVISAGFGFGQLFPDTDMTIGDHEERLPARPVDHGFNSPPSIIVLDTHNRPIKMVIKQISEGLLHGLDSLATNNSIAAKRNATDNESRIMAEMVTPIQNENAVILILSFIYGADLLSSIRSHSHLLSEKKESKRTSTYKSGEARWLYEWTDLLRQKWYYNQRQAIFRAIHRLYLTTHAQVCILIFPDTLNAVTMSTVGRFSDFIRASAAVLAGMRRRKTSTLSASITEVWARFSQDPTTNRTKSFDTIFASMAPHVDSAVLTRARRALDDEIAFQISSAGEFDPRKTRFSKNLQVALETYAAAGV